MAVNVTQKDKTLNDVISWCREHVANIDQMIPDAHCEDFVTGERFALQSVIEHCEKQLGYTGSMPLEVPNQSEQAHVMTTALSNLDWGQSPQFDHYECSCGYSTRDPYEAESHINVRKQLGQSVYWKEATES